MKRTLTFPVLALMLIVATVFTGCGKYEEGPGISLLSKKKRLCRSWQVESIAYGSVTFTPGEDESEDYYFTFNKDGQFSQTIGTTTYTGTWDFTDEKESIRVTYGGISEEYTIMRLTNDELWFTDDEGYYYRCVEK